MISPKATVDTPEEPRPAKHTLYLEKNKQNYL